MSGMMDDEEGWTGIDWIYGMGGMMDDEEVGSKLSIRNLRYCCPEDHEIKHGLPDFFWPCAFSLRLLAWRSTYAKIGKTCGNMV